MDQAVTPAIAELEAPRANVAREVGSYLTMVSRAQDEYVDALANATAFLTDRAAGLATEAALQARLAQQFVDAQRSVLRCWADTDAKVQRITETASLEAAMLGLAGGFVTEPHVAERSAAEHDLRRLLDRWWAEARAECGAAIELAQAESAQWVEVARLSAGTSADAQPDDATDHDDDASHAVAPLPPVLAGVLDAVAGGSLVDLLDELAALLEQDDTDLDEIDVAAPVTVEGLSPCAPSAAVITLTAQDGFDRFWGQHRAPAPQRESRHVVRDAVIPMMVVALVLVIVLSLIG